LDFLDNYVDLYHFKIIKKRVYTQDNITTERSVIDNNQDLILSDPSTGVNWLDSVPEMIPELTLSIENIRSKQYDVVQVKY
jgi:hypothetical protein